MSRQMVYTCDLPECEQLAPADGAIGWIEIATLGPALHTYGEAPLGGEYCTAEHARQALELWLDWKRRNA
jgi:hypothetical protein